MKKQSKQKSPTTTTRSNRKLHALDARGLSAVRGGLGITVEEPPPPTQIMQQQHSERLLRL